MDIFESFENNGIIGLTPELRAKYTYEYFKKSNKSVLFVCSSLYEANKYYQRMLNYTKDVVFFPMDDFLTSEALAVSPELKITRLESLKELVEEKRIVVTNLKNNLIMKCLGVIFFTFSLGVCLLSWVFGLIFIKLIKIWP